MAGTRIVLGALLLASLPVHGVAAQQAPPPPPGAYAASPYLGEVRNEVLFGDIWERPQLSKRDRSLITIAVNQALYATNEFRLHVERGLDNGVTQDEIAELIAHVTLYSGFPTGMNAARAAGEAFQARGLPVRPARSTPRQREPVVPPEYPNAAQSSPYLAALLNDLIYGEIWERPDLSKRDRSLITVAVAQAMYVTPELRSHIGRALDNGVTQEEISEIITHITFYAGFPTGVNAARAAEDIFRQRGLPLAQARYPAAPYLDVLLDDMLFGVAWERPELSKRDRSLITMAVAQTLYATDQLRSHMGRALDNGVTPEEISELVAHVTFYSGFPRGVNSSRTAAEVFEARGIPLPGQ
jgi:4-carboxymuconolactone decarboxylase